jgi:hypothetical protein
LPVSAQSNRPGTIEESGNNIARFFQIIHDSYRTVVLAPGQLNSVFNIYQLLQERGKYLKPVIWIFLNQGKERYNVL